MGAVAIEYKTFGVGLIFTPTVLSKDKIVVDGDRPRLIDLASAERLELAPVGLPAATLPYAAPEVVRGVV